MDKRTILAIVLIFGIFYFYPQYMKKFGPQPVPKTQKVIKQDESASDGPGRDEMAPEERSRPVLQSRPTETPAFAVTDTLPIQDVTVETDLYRMVISTLGMTIKSCRFKNYLDDRKEWVEIIPPGAVGTFDIEFKSLAPKKEVRLQEYIYKSNKNNLLLSGEGKNESVTFTANGPDGLILYKEIKFYSDKYFFDIKVDLNVPPAYDVEEFSIVWLPGLKPTESDFNRDQTAFGSAYKVIGEDVETNGFKEKKRTQQGRIEWLSAKTKYFALAMIPLSLLDSGKELALEISEQEQPIPWIESAKEKDRHKAVSLRLKVPYKRNRETTFRAYLGPQDYEILKDVGIGLEKMMDLGWPVIRQISLLIMKFLVWMHRFIPNYGITIIIFSIVIKVLFYPLTKKSFTATREMQKLQPLMAEIKEKYKGDSQKVNQETMKLYKDRGVNPLGGCLPMLLQMPVFFALFKVFNTTIDLRGAEFAFWLTDLSKSDPTYILPVFMGLTMFLQQKMSSGGIQDERQKMMMYLMPVMFTFFFFRLSSGLILYYTIFNILSIGQQYLINRAEKSGDVVAVVPKGGKKKN